MSTTAPVLEAGAPQPSGAHWTGNGTNFAVFSDIADRVELCLFDASGQERARLALPSRHDSASEKVLSGKPFAVFSVSRRYYKGNVKTMRQLGKERGGTFVADTHFVSDGGQVMSMWSWLVFMRHNAVKRRWFGVPLPKPNLAESYEEQATTFINGVVETALESPATSAD